MKEKIILLIVSIIMSNCVLYAQSYYDDDIYYDASKVEKVEKKNKGNFDYDGSDVYVVNGTMDVDVDTYNRRNMSNVVDTTGIDSLASKDFLYTRRIEKFYDPNVVKNSGDSTLIVYYNNSLEDDDIDVNIYVGASPYWATYGFNTYNWWYGYPYWNSSMYWNYYWYGPSWHYNPYWSWYGWWGPSWYPGPCYYPPHHHYPHYIGYNPARYNRRPASSGAYRPVRPGYNDRRPGTRYGNYRPSGYNDYRPSDKNSKPSLNGRRPGANKRTDHNSNYNKSTDRNKGSYSPSRSGSRPSGFSGGSRSGGGVRGGRSGRH